MKKGVDFTGVCIIYACHDNRGRYLLQKRGDSARDEQGRWDVGGGALEFGDSVEETLRKEIQEEYKTDIVQYEFLGFRDVHREHDGKKTHWVALDFKVLVNPKKAGNGEPHKFDAVEWFTLDSLPSPLHSQLPVFFKNYRDRL
jgi:8-oxo-dGTP pyrophosphatase MutT (NUDIX family)